MSNMRSWRKYIQIAAIMILMMLVFFIYAFDWDWITYSSELKMQWKTQAPVRQNATVNSKENLNIFFQHLIKDERHFNEEADIQETDIEYLFGNLPSTTAIPRKSRHKPGLNCTGLTLFKPNTNDMLLMDNFTCVHMNVTPKPVICIHNPAKDVFVSRQLLHDGVWERHIVARFLHVMDKLGKDTYVLDLGANIGVYSLLASTRGYRVIAVEPFRDNLLRLYKGIKLNGVGGLVTVVANAVSDSTGTGCLHLNPDNQGDTRIVSGSSTIVQQKSKPGNSVNDNQNGSHYTTNFTVNIITLQCLIPLLRSKTVVIKVDIQGYEDRAFRQFSKFLKHVNVPIIFMEWVGMREIYGSEITESLEKESVQSMVNMFMDLGYRPYSSITGEQLHEDYWFGWPEDVFWERKL